MLCAYLSTSMPVGDFGRMQNQIRSTLGIHQYFRGVLLYHLLNYSACATAKSFGTRPFQVAGGEWRPYKSLPPPLRFIRYSRIANVEWDHELEAPRCRRGA